MKALVMLENKDELVEDFELVREYDRIRIELASGEVFNINVTFDGKLEIYCSEGSKGLMTGTALGVSAKSSNVFQIKAGVV